MNVPELTDEEIENISSSDKLQEKIVEYTTIYNFYQNMQMSVKLFMNSTYGALANRWFAGYLVQSAEAITLQGQDAIKFSIKAVQHYFYNLWHKDTELHQKLGVTNVRQIDENQEVTVYGDTDSIDKDSVVTINGKEITAEDAWNVYQKLYGYKKQKSGHETINTKGSTVLNWSKDKGLYQAPMSKIISY